MIYVIYVNEKDKLQNVLFQGFGKLPSDPTIPVRGQALNTEMAVGSGSHHYRTSSPSGFWRKLLQNSGKFPLTQKASQFLLFSFVSGLWQAMINWAQLKIRIRWWTEISSVNFSQFDNARTRKSPLILHLSPIWFRKLDSLDQAISYCNQGRG